MPSVCRCGLMQHIRGLRVPGRLPRTGGLCVYLHGVRGMPDFRDSPGLHDHKQETARLCMRQLSQAAFGRAGGCALHDEARPRRSCACLWQRRARSAGRRRQPCVRQPRHAAFGRTARRGTSSRAMSVGTRGSRESTRCVPSAPGGAGRSLGPRRACCAPRYCDATARQGGCEHDDERHHGHTKFPSARVGDNRSRSGRAHGEPAAFSARTSRNRAPGLRSTTPLAARPESLSLWLDFFERRRCGSAPCG